MSSVGSSRGEGGRASTQCTSLGLVKDRLGVVHLCRIGLALLPCGWVFTSFTFFSVFVNACFLLDSRLGMFKCFISM